MDDTIDGYIVYYLTSDNVLGELILSEEYMDEFLDYFGFDPPIVSEYEIDVFLEKLNYED